MFFGSPDNANPKTNRQTKKISLLKKFLNPEGLHVYRTNNDEIVATPVESNIRVSMARENSTMLQHGDQVCPNPTRGKQRKHSLQITNMPRNIEIIIHSGYEALILFIFYRTIMFKD